MAMKPRHYTAWIAIICLVQMVLISVLMEMPIANDHIVGDTTNGWNLGVDYDTWVAAKTFYVGDNLIFNYGSTHDVVQVTQSEYESCTLASSDNTYSMGPTNVTLTQIGTTYYICSVPNHCSNGMKLSVTAIAPSTSFDSSSSTTIPSSNSSSYFGTITPSSSTPNSSASLQLPTFSLVAILLLAFSFISFT